MGAGAGFTPSICLCFLSNHTGCSIIAVGRICSPMQATAVRKQRAGRLIVSLEQRCKQLIDKLWDVVVRLQGWEPCRGSPLWDANQQAGNLLHLLAFMLQAWESVSVQAYISLRGLRYDGNCEE